MGTAKLGDPFLSRRDWSYALYETIPPPPDIYQLRIVCGPQPLLASLLFAATTLAQLPPQAPIIFVGAMTPPSFPIFGKDLAATAPTVAVTSCVGFRRASVSGTLQLLRPLAMRPAPDRRCLDPSVYPVCTVESGRPTRQSDAWTYLELLDEHRSPSLYALRCCPMRSGRAGAPAHVSIREALGDLTKFGAMDSRSLSQFSHRLNGDIPFAITHPTGQEL